MYGSKTLLCSSKFPRASKRISSKFIHNLGTRPQKGSPAVVQKAEKYSSVAVVNLRIDITVPTNVCQAQLIHPRPTLSC